MKILFVNTQIIQLSVAFHLSVVKRSCVKTALGLEGETWNEAYRWGSLSAEGVWVARRQAVVGPEPAHCQCG